MNIIIIGFSSKLTSNFGANVRNFFIHWTVPVSHAVCHLLFGFKNCNLFTAPALYVSYISTFSGNTFLWNCTWKPEDSSFYPAYLTGQSVDLIVIGNPVFTLSSDLSFPYRVINGTKVITVHTFTCNSCKFNTANQIGQCLDFHNDRKSFLSSFSPVASSWMRTYTSCDDVTRWRQEAFAYAVNRSNAS